MYPNYYGTQLNTIIGYQENIYIELQKANTNLNIIKNNTNLILCALGIAFTLGIIRHMLAR